MGSEVDEVLKAAIEASDRTTRAVRAIAIFLFISVASSLVAGTAFVLAFAFPQVNHDDIGVGSTEPAPWWLTIAILIQVIGLIWGLSAGVGELGFSRAKAWRLTHAQTNEWQAAGSPSLDSWDTDLQSFDAWLRSRAKPEAAAE